MALDDRYITLAHGNGGRFMRELIDDLFARHLGNDVLDTTLDAACLPIDRTLPATEDGVDLMTTVDAFTVQPLEFPGGSIGSLAVNGTVNDLAVAGARPLFLTLSAIIEEGLEVAQLERIVASFAAAAKTAGVRVAAGDTKVVPRGAGGGLYLTTTGLGVKPDHLDLGLSFVRPGDRLLVSGPVGDHGISVMLAREAFELSGNIASDCASVLPLTTALLGLPGLRFMRDPTRGGLATVGHELARATNLTVRMEETAIPVRDGVRAVCDILGYDPYYLACEGRVIAVVAADDAAEALQRWQALPEGRDAATIGELAAGEARVSLRTSIGGERVLLELEDDPLPRIC